ncbi:hypothetical protein WPS_08300 [Vulcanimicrobium alpinum]|uniref:Uncharacterized protein n=1 Tax=Vulcanimicrobium alpinum TaxID=3016050 RepID=A0AAN1XU39_UNVUL|nr:hypothetical protein [Vulcanimicrobium alpinum]BDE05554.1 hypothetical protein WPS_08300 [Vulcanimicrobium alpinum]
MTSSNTLINERPFYYSRLAVDPHDENHLFSVSVKLAESTNGGKTWHESGKRLHGDHHDLWIAADGRTILEANDGGVALSRDGGARWQWRYVLPISLACHVGFDLASPYRVCGGMQDNGAWCAPSRTGDDRGIGAHDWTRVAGGDGTWVVPDPHDPSTVFASAGGGDNQGETVRFDRTHASTVDVSVYLRNQNVVPPSELQYRFNWETPLAFSPQHPHVLYTAGNVAFVSADRGAHWRAISGDLTRNLRERQTLSGGVRLDVTGAETFDTILAIAPSPLADGLLWVSTDDGLVQLTRDGGANWTRAEIPGVDADGRIPSIAASVHRAGTAYVAVDRTTPATVLPTCTRPTTSARIGARSPPACRTPKCTSCAKTRAIPMSCTPAPGSACGGASIAARLGNRSRRRSPRSRCATSRCSRRPSTCSPRRTAADSTCSTIRRPCASSRPRRAPACGCFRSATHCRCSGRASPDMPRAASTTRRRRR